VNPVHDVRRAAGIAPNAWRRHLHLMIDGFCAEDADPASVAG
jgi:hypothetical protein